MPEITRRFIKSGMIYLVLGVLLAFVAGLPSVNAGSLLLPVYWHMIALGWLTQTIMGVSLWMFPRTKKNRKKTASVSAFVAFWSLNTGLVLRFVTEPFLPLVRSQPAVVWSVTLSSVLLFVAVLFYCIEIWPRVQTRKKGKRRK